MRSPLLYVLAAYHLLLGLFMCFAPQQFYEALAGYSPYNDHFIRDLSTYNLALGPLLAVSVTRAHWQVPLLLVTAVQYALHVLNHLWDIGDTDPAYQGPFSTVSLFLLGCLISWLLHRAMSEERGRSTGA